MGLVPAVSRYDMYCPIARALDILGDRWTLLILRELNLGDHRFTDLKRDLPGIPPNVLSSRLKALIEHDLVATRELPPPAARTVYTITERGRDTAPILRSLVRFGVPELQPAGPATEVRPATAVQAGLVPYYDRDAASGIDERYLLIVDGEEHRLSSLPGQRPDHRGTDFDLVLAGPAWAFMAARQGHPSLADSMADHTVVRQAGSRRALRNFQRIFALH
jgi:DNA-binding HxlR family transcriptional regulator